MHRHIAVHRNGRVEGPVCRWGRRRCEDTTSEISYICSLKKRPSGRFGCKKQNKITSSHIWKSDDPHQNTLKGLLSQFHVFSSNRAVCEDIIPHNAAEVKGILTLEQRSSDPETAFRLLWIIHYLHSEQLSQGLFFSIDSSSIETANTEASGLSRLTGTQFARR